MGRPNDPENQRQILRTALDLDYFSDEEWSVHELPFQWTDDGNRDWEDTVRDLYRSSWGVVASHVAKNKGATAPLPGREVEFTIQCNC